MKVKLIEVPAWLGDKLYVQGDKAGQPVPKPEPIKCVIFWCAGCGAFHSALAEKWNGDKDDPTISGEVFTPNPELPNCICSVYRGVVSWDKSSKHRLAGKSIPMQHEEAWRGPDHPWDSTQAPAGWKPQPEEAPHEKQVEQKARETS